MTRFLLVCLAGAAGTGARLALASVIASVFGTQFPYGTIVVNVVGSFLMGAVVYASVATELVPPTLRLVLVTGFLGGFTTYSAFNHETIVFLQTRVWGRALANVALTLIACLAAGFTGGAVARRLFGG